MVAVNETKLDKSTETLKLPGYTLCSRRDRSSGAGGVALFAKDGLAQTVVHLADSETHERSWHLVHTTQGPLLLCVWYRPPCRGETASVDTFEEEWHKYSDQALGTLVVGDLNVHHKRWLKFSSDKTPTTPEGTALSSCCNRLGLEQKVDKPTRRDKATGAEHLLDLVLTDLHDGVQCEVLPRLADHSAVLVKFFLDVPKQVPVQRECWKYSKADWAALNKELAETNWNQVLFGTENLAGRTLTEEQVDTAATKLTRHVLDTARKHIPVRRRTVFKSTHPWLDEHCKALVQKKRAAEGTPEYDKRVKECSEGVLQAYKAYVKKTREDLKKLPRSSKKWWSMARSLAQKSERNSSIPPLKSKKDWVTEAKGKAALFLETFTTKYKLPPPVENSYSNAYQQGAGVLTDFWVVRTRHAEEELNKLKEDKATGPDLLAATVLKRCAKTLALPVAKLARAMLAAGRWPEEWRTHWVVPLYKKKSVYDPANYRGVHLSAQLSKVVERLLGRYFLPFLEGTNAYGTNQFAYRQGRGSKDALALNTLQWLWWLDSGKKVGLYCSDVSGAFDRVATDRLLRKLEARGVRGKALKLLGSWLEERRAVVVVDGKRSEEAVLQNMVYQGTVWGPPLWNTYFCDSSAAVRASGFCDVYFADDLNCYKVFDGKLSVETVEDELEECQASLHEWGAGNQVLFDASKESFHVLHKRQPKGDSFRVLGVHWDTKLRMEEQCHEVGKRASWKLRTLLKTLKYYDLKDLVAQYKAQVLPTVEFSTPAVYHCTTTALEDLDRAQHRFLREVQLSPEEALAKHKLAPLQTRRDIAMLGLIHRTVLGRSPPHFSNWFFLADCVPPAHNTRAQEKKHNKQLYDWLATRDTELLRRSALGLVRVYNKLPQEAVNKKTVKDFQSWLQKYVAEEAQKGTDDWQNLLNLRKRSWKQTKST